MTVNHRFKRFNFQRHLTFTGRILECLEVQGFFNTNQLASHAWDHPQGCGALMEEALLGSRHQILSDGQARITDRLDRMERELGSMIKFSYAELDQRIRVIENEFQTLKIRLDRLEKALQN